MGIPGSMLAVQSDKLKQLEYSFAPLASAVAQIMDIQRLRDDI